ncbi:MAG TPA: LPS export ABC transporter ATP-binding protein [Proteobacteria bacterium]|nr:lipopolysaccharide export system ATP-binding protein LptB [bacterium BMS3Abin14]HDL54220.1 LPS export ABC transporter ATP-binding protein [Pseudomonadota bacterium]
MRLVAESLIKRYGKRTAVDGVSITLSPGEVVGLLGPNGAGKTTTFYMIAGMVRPDGGQVLLNGTDMTRWPVHRRARAGLGYLPQEPSIFRGMTVQDNLLSVMEAVGIPAGSRNALLEELTEAMGVAHLGKSLGGKLSGGERRRVEIARALVSDPAYLLLDEPFAGIDPITVLELQKLIRMLRDRNLGILITDHNVRECLGITDRAYILAAGKILEEGSPEMITSSEKARKVYFGEGFSL